MKKLFSLSLLKKVFLPPSSKVQLMVINLNIILPFKHNMFLFIIIFFFYNLVVERGEILTIEIITRLIELYI